MPGEHVPPPPPPPPPDLPVRDNTSILTWCNGRWAVVLTGAGRWCCLSSCWSAWGSCWLQGCFAPAGNASLEHVYIQWSLVITRTLGLWHLPRSLYKISYYIDQGKNGCNYWVTPEVCNRNFELLCVSFRAFYLLREFNRVDVFLVYIPSDANTATAICDAKHAMETALPDSPKIILRNFNLIHYPLEDTLQNYVQREHGRSNKGLSIVSGGGEGEMRYTVLSHPPTNNR